MQTSGAMRREIAASHSTVIAREGEGFAEVGQIDDGV
jgi:hypothetical protein